MSAVGDGSAGGPPGERPGAVLARVDAELRALWSTPPVPGETPRARACTMNLVVVAATPSLAQRWTPVVDQVLENVPARAIVVGLDPGGGDALEASTTAVCTPGAAGGLVCSERVTLVARGAVCTRLPSCVASLCATDVPTTLVWLGSARVDDAVFATLGREAARVVLDAAYGSLGSLAAVARWAESRRESDPGEGPWVADLAWTRLAPWQEMCARIFDEPRLRALASGVTRVTLVQASARGERLGAEGSLLLGWLATRLGWQAPRTGVGSPPASDADDAGTARPGGVEVVLRADPGSRAPREALVAVRIEASAEVISAQGEIARDPGDADAATWRLEIRLPGAAPQRIEQHVRLRSTATAGVLERTLHRPPDDRTLAESAAWAAALRGEELACGVEGDSVATGLALVRAPA